MADLEALTLPSEAEEQEVATALRRDQLVQKRAAAQQAAAAKGQVTGPEATAEAAASEVIRQAYIKGWQYIQESVEDLSLAYFGLASIVTGPIVIGMYFTRFIVGSAMGGGGTIGYRGIQVPLVPGYGAIEFPYRTGKFLLISAITGILYFILILLLLLATSGDEIVNAIFGSITGTIWETIKNFFGGVSNPLTSSGI